MKVKELRELIEEDGWVLDRQSGSHMQFKHPTKPGVVTLAGHKPSQDVAIGTMINILKQAGLR